MFQFQTITNIPSMHLFVKQNSLTRITNCDIIIAAGCSAHGRQRYQEVSALSWGLVLQFNQCISYYLKYRRAGRFRAITLQVPAKHQSALGDPLGVLGHAVAFFSGIKCSATYRACSEIGSRHPLSLLYPGAVFGCSCAGGFPFLGLVGGNFGGKLNKRQKKNP